MNFRRGFKRIALVLATLYFLVGGLMLILNWMEAGTRKHEFANCMGAARESSQVNVPKGLPKGDAIIPDSPGPKYEDYQGNPINPSIHPKAPTQPIVINFEGVEHQFPSDFSQAEIQKALQQSCQKAHPANYSDQWSYTILFFLFPTVLYCAWKLLVWIVKGFQAAD
jgi:hypothetical protein